MNYAIHRISLDVTDDSPSQLTISAKQGDNAKRLIIALLDDKKNYQIADGCYATFIAKKSNGKWLSHPCIIENNKVIYDFQTSTVSTVGMLDCEILLFNKILFRNEDGVLVTENEDGTHTEVYENITTASFMIAVHGTIMSGIEDDAEADKTTMEDLIKRGNALCLDMESKMTEADNKQDEVDELLGELEGAIANVSYEPIRIESFCSTQESFEKGTRVTSITLRWKLSKAPTSQTVTDSNGEVSASINVVNESTHEYMMTISYGATPLTDDISYTLTVIGEKGETDTSDCDVTFFSYVYYGASTIPNGGYSASFVKGLSEKSKGYHPTSFTVSPAAKQYIYYCSPQSLPTPTFKDAETGLLMGVAYITTVVVTNNNNSESYDIYCSDYDDLGEITINVS